MAETPRTEPADRVEPQAAFAAADHRTQDHALVVLGPPTDVPPGFLLTASRLTLGAGEDDDVFLTGVGVVPGHVNLIFLEGRMTLLSAMEEVRVDGKTVTTFPFEFAPLQALSLSPDTHLSYGPAGSLWPQQPVWALPEAALESEEAVPTGPTQASQASASDRMRSGKPRSRKDWALLTARMGGVAVGAAALIVCALVAFDVIWGSREVVNPGEMAIDRSEDVLARLLASDPASFSTVKLTVRNDGALAVTGFLPSEVAYRKLAEQARRELVESGGNVRLDAMTSERLSALVRDSLSRLTMGSRLDVSADSVHIHVFGVEPDPVALARLKAELDHLTARVAPYKLELDLRVQTADQFGRDVLAALARSPATRDMQFRLEEGGARITGLVAAAVEVEARAALAELEKDFADRLPLTFDLKVDPKLNFKVVSLALGGDTSSATLAQRGKLQTFRVGETVFGTGELTDIKGDGVMLALGRREVFIPLIR